MSGRFRNAVLRVMGKLPADQAQSSQNSQPCECGPVHNQKIPFTDEAWWEPTSQEEVALLRQSWSSDVQFARELGNDIYEYIFEHAPDAQKLFPKANKIGRNWRRSDGFAEQSMKFVSVLEVVMTLLDKPSDQLDTYLAEVGARHVRFVNRGFRTYYWEVFKNAIHTAIRNQIEQEQFIVVPVEIRSVTFALWDHLSVYMTRRMFGGFCTELVRHRVMLEAEAPEQPKILKKWEDRKKSLSKERKKSAPTTSAID